MNKTIHFLSLILVICLGCSGFELENKRYAVEKAYFEADRQVQGFSIKPELRGPQDYMRLVDSYMQVYRTFQANFPNLAPGRQFAMPEIEALNLSGKALLSASALLLSSEKPDSAQVILKMIIDSPIMLNQHRFDAMFALGNVNERLGRWPEAEAVYTRLVDEYYPPAVRSVHPNADVLELPKKIAEHYARRYEMDAAKTKAQWAIDYYEGILDSFPKIPMTMMATRLLAEMYNATGGYQRAADLLATVVDSAGKMFDPARIMMADLYVTQLNRKPDAIAIYSDVLNNGTDSLAISTSYIKLATLAFDDNRFQEGREKLEELRKRFPGLPNIQAEAQLLKAKSFESEKDDERARQEYIALLNAFPDTPQALEVLTWLPEYFGKTGQIDLQRDWTARSERELRELIVRNADRNLGAQATNYLGTFLLRNKRVEEALAQFETLRQNYPRTSLAEHALYQIGCIYHYELKNDEKAMQAFQEFLKQYPGSGVRPSVEAEMKKINQT